MKESLPIREAQPTIANTLDNGVEVRRTRFRDEFKSWGLWIGAAGFAAVLFGVSKTISEGAGLGLGILTAGAIVQVVGQIIREREQARQAQAQRIILHNKL